MTAEAQTVAEQLIESLIERGVDTLFALPGVQLDPFFDAVARAPELRVVHTRHEQTTSYMAFGYAQATSRPGVCVVVPGPGITHAGAGLATAWATYTPVLLIAGELFGGRDARGTGALHEIPNQTAVIEGTIGHSRPITSPDGVIDALDDAFDRLSGPEVRPAAIEISPDVLRAEAPAPKAATVTTQAAPSVSMTDAIAAAIRDAQQPLIIVGGGARACGPAVQELADRLGAPIVTSRSGKGVVDDRLSTVLPHVAAFPLVRAADVVVVVGSRFGVNDLGRGELDDRTTVVRIDTDDQRAAESMPNGATTLPMAGDAATAVSALLASEINSAPAPWRDQAAQLRTEIFETMAVEFPVTWQCANAVRAALPDDGILVDEMTQVAYLARNAPVAYHPEGYVNSGIQGTLGFGYPTALGAKIGRPDRAVVSISGDGGFGYNIGELATAAHHGIGVVAVVFTDGAFGNVKGMQQRVYGHDIATDLTNPDYVALAASFGITGAQVDDLDQLEATIAAGIEADTPMVIEVPIGAQPYIWPRLQGQKQFDLPSG